MNIDDGLWEEMGAFDGSSKRENGRPRAHVGKPGVSLMNRERALEVLQVLLDSFASPEIIDALQANSGPGYRFYATERHSDAFVREAREALRVLRENK